MGGEQLVDGLARGRQGRVFVIGQALAVALFAELQWFGLKRSQMQPLAS
ncbi:hypothetical protein [Zestomonas thermotolerans]|nr:hypothetical protein [Pseudomonas thermotolerans]